MRAHQQHESPLNLPADMGRQRCTLFGVHCLKEWEEAPSEAVSGRVLLRENRDDLMPPLIRMPLFANRQVEQVEAEGFTSKHYISHPTPRLSNTLPLPQDNSCQSPPQDRDVLAFKLQGWLLSSLFIILILDPTLAIGCTQ